jgi:uncharacterized protein
MRATALVFTVLFASACHHPSDFDALTDAVRAGDMARTRALLAGGADPNRPTGINEWPPLLHAVHKNQLATAEELLRHGADPDRGGPEGMTPLMMASGYGNEAMVALLLHHGADPHLRTRDGASALDFALTGVSDIDKFTLFQCQDATAALLARAHVSAQTSSRAWARVKRCTS